MKKIHVLLVLVLVMLAMVGVASAAPSDTRTFVSPLSGEQEVPPRDTDASGIATYKLNGSETRLRYRLSVSDIENVTAAHIHCGSFGVNGPVGATLYTAAPAGGPIEGVIAKGSITAPDAGNGCGWTTLADIVAAIRSGDTYTNVHTNDGVAPTNTGPGDFPGGEIRGQIYPAGQ